MTAGEGWGNQSPRFNKAKCKVLHLGGATPAINTALLRRTWGCWFMKSWTWATDVRSQPRRPTVSWAASKEAWPAGWGRWVCPSALLCSALLCSGETSPGVLRPALEPSAQERHGPVGVGPEEGDKWSEGWSSSPMRKGWENQGCSAWRREGCGETLLWPFST